MSIKKSKRGFLIFTIVLLGLAFVLFYIYRKEKVYVLTEYNSVTKVTNVSQYVIRENDTVFQGIFLTYNKDGDKIAEGNFVDNEPSGKFVYYYDNGNIESIQYRINSNLNAEAIWNYPEGNIERYVLYDDFGIPDFLIRYDEQGNVKSYEGLPVVEIYQYKIANKEKFKINVNQNLKVGDTLKYKYLVANIPNAKRTFKLEMVGFENTDTKRKIINKPPVYVEVNEILQKKGLTQIKAFVEYKFNDNKKTIIKDSTYFGVNVNW